VAEARELDRHAGMAFSPDSTLVAFTRREGTRNDLLLCDATTGLPRRQFPVPGFGMGVVWHPSGDSLFVLSSTLFLLLDAVTGRQLPTLTEPPPAGVVPRFDRTGDLIITNDWSGRVRLWNATTGQQTLSFPSVGCIVECSRDEDLLGTQTAG